MKKDKKNFLTLDLEMNQPSGKIIQIGAVAGDLSGNIIDKISIYVNPYEVVSERIVKLCDIHQKDVDSGLSLHEAYLQLKNFHLKHDCFINPITWGGGDSELLRRQMNIDIEDLSWCFGRRWIDAKTIFTSYQLANGLPIQGGLAKAMTKFGLFFSGRKHNAADDAENTFILYTHMLNSFMKKERLT